MTATSMLSGARASQTSQRCQR